MNNFEQTLFNDLKAFLKLLTNGFYFNERDLQVNLAFYLNSTKHYDSIELEYLVPNVMIPKIPNNNTFCPWKNDFYIDLVVSKKGEYIPIELKYKTKLVHAQINRFGLPTPSAIDVVKTHSAQDMGRYDFWKDVRRVELLKKAFSKSVKHGFCVFVTNDPAYTKIPRTGSNYTNFSMEPAQHGPYMSWLKMSSVTQNRPNFILDCPYTINWVTTQQQCGSKSVETYYTIVMV